EAVCLGAADAPGHDGPAGSVQGRADARRDRAQPRSEQARGDDPDVRGTAGERRPHRYRDLAAAGSGGRVEVIGSDLGLAARRAASALALSALAGAACAKSTPAPVAPKAQP